MDRLFPGHPAGGNNYDNFLNTVFEGWLTCCWMSFFVRGSEHFLTLEVKQLVWMTEMLEI